MMKLVYVAALAAMMPAAVVAQTTATPPREPDIETVGTGIRRIAPDRAFVHVIVQSRARLPRPRRLPMHRPCRR